MLKEALLEVEDPKASLNKYDNPQDEYNKCWTVVTKIVYLITKVDKQLRSSEIIPLLLTREPSIVNKQVSLEKHLSDFLNTATKYGRVIPYKLKELGVVTTAFLNGWMRKESY